MQCQEVSGEGTNVQSGIEWCNAVRSRRVVIKRLRAAVLSRMRGLLLVTGEPGTGKTWTSEQLAASLPGDWRSSRVDLTNSLQALDFLTLMGSDLGVPQTSRLSGARLRLQAALHDEHRDGRNWLLVVDNAQRATPEVWDEIQVLGDQAGSPGGFGSVLVLGDTALIRMAASRAFRSFAASLNAHDHLPPLDLDETRELLGLSDEGNEPQTALEELHRDAAGNPRRLLRLASTQTAIGLRRTANTSAHYRPLAATTASLASPKPAAKLHPEHSNEDIDHQIPKPLAPQPLASTPAAVSSALPPGREQPSAVTLTTVPPALIPVKPPIRIEDGLVEVGWEGDLEAEFTGSDEPITPSAELSSASGAAAALQETVVEDRYAALQAWTEQAANRLRARSEERAIAEPLGDDDAGPSPTATYSGEPDESEPRHALAPAKIRAEGQHEFAPYSQLFTRMRQSS
jgi:type II secretory pathway predicted ATPase ExeA